MAPQSVPIINPKRPDICAWKYAPMVAPTRFQSTVSTIPIRLWDRAFPSMSQSICVSSKYKVLARVLIPVPIIIPIAYQSIVATRLLSMVVNAVMKAVICAPTLSQLINSVNFCTASLIFSPMSFPIPSQSPAANISFSLLAKSLIPLSIPTVSNMSEGLAPPPPPPEASAPCCCICTRSSNGASAFFASLPALLAAPPVFLRLAA